MKRELTEENVAKVRQLTALAKELGLTMSQLAPAWTPRRAEISSVITGATRLEHVLSSVQAAGVHLGTEALDKIEGILGNKP